MRKTICSGVLTTPIVCKREAIVKTFSGLPPFSPLSAPFQPDNRHPAGFDFLGKLLCLIDKIRHSIMPLFFELRSVFPLR